MIIKPDFEVIIYPPHINGIPPDLSRPKYKIILCRDVEITCFFNPPSTIQRWFLRKLFGFQFIIYKYDLEIQEE